MPLKHNRNTIPSTAIHCPTCGAEFKAGESRYGATLLEHDCGRLRMTQIFLCPRCSRNAIKRNSEGKKAIELLLAFVKEIQHQGAAH